MNSLVRLISTSSIQAPKNNSDNNNGNSNDFQKIDLTPWDLQILPLEYNQKGLLFTHPADIEHPSSKNNVIDHLKQTLSLTLSYFPPLAGRLVITQHEEDHTASCFINCNNVGALFVHAKAENISITDITQPKDHIVPPIVNSFFPLNGVKNWNTSHPILAVQVTELLDGIFIGFTINHVVSDGQSFWHFVNSWSQISRGGGSFNKLPSLKRWFPNDIHELPIRFPFTNEFIPSPKSINLAEGVFNFTKEKIAELKSKANTETNKTEKITISSLQAVLAHVLCSVVRCERLDPQEDVLYLLMVGVRPRMIPPLEDEYFGNAVLVDGFTMKAGEILECGIGKVALEMNKVISLHSNDEKIKKWYESWLKTPKLLLGGDLSRCYSFTTSSSPRFDCYGNDFGWGKPVAVRNGGANRRNGKITVFSGAEEGSIDIIPSLPYKVLEAMGNDTEFIGKKIN